MIDLIGVEKFYPQSIGMVHALKNINLHVKRGEVFGIIGKSGAGKSSLLRCVNFLERPSEGIVRVAGEDLTEMNAAQLREARAHMGMIFQHFNLLKSATVYENIALPLRLTKTPEGEIKRTVNSLLELTELTQKTSVYPSQLSGGEKQRVAIARALANKPRVLLCDEATSALDHNTTHAILALLNNINQQLGLTILLITHEMDVIKTICDRVAVLDHGEIVEENTVSTFLMHPKSSMGKMLSMAALKQELPPNLEHRLILADELPISAEHNPLLRVFFQGEVTEMPIITSLVQHFGCKLNILQANIENTKEHALAVMLLEVLNCHSHLKDMKDYLHQKGTIVEQIGYVKRAIHTAA